MKKLIVLSLSLLSLTLEIHAQQTSFVNTIQDFRARVIDFREDGLPGCIRDGVLVNPSPAELRKGDVFIDVDGNAKMVAAVTKVGGDIYIDTVDPSFGDVFLYAEIPEQVIVFNQDNFREESVSGKGYALPKSARSPFAANVSFEKEIYSNPPAVVKINAGADLTSSMSIGFKAPSFVQFEIRTWKFWEWSIGFRYERGYISGNLDYDLDLSGGITFALEKSIESKPILLYGFKTPVPGFSADLGLFTKTILEGKLELALPITFNIAGKAGAKCTLDGQFPYMVPTDLTKWGNIDFAVTLDPALTAEAALKQKFYLGAEVTLAGFKITEFEAGGGPYIKVNGTLSGSIGYSSATGLIGPSWSASATGEIGVFTDISGKVCDGKWSVSIMSYEFPIFTLFEASTEEDDRRLGGIANPNRAPIALGAR